jgi:hypothetical protein
MGILQSRLVVGGQKSVAGVTHRAVVTAFATPILGGIGGPVTSFVLDKMRGK